MEGKGKRERAANFSKKEVDILGECVLLERNIIENKCTDAVSWKDKVLAWERVAQAFNASSGSVARNAKTLRLKYEVMKKTIRKKNAQNTQELYRTGGGISEAVPLSNVEEKIFSIASNICGLPARNDSDAIEDFNYEMSAEPDEYNDENQSVTIAPGVECMVMKSGEPVASCSSMEEKQVVD